MCNGPCSNPGACFCVPRVWAISDPETELQAARDRERAHQRWADPEGWRKRMSQDSELDAWLEYQKAEDERFEQLAGLGRDSLTDSEEALLSDGEEALKAFRALNEQIDREIDAAYRLIVGEEPDAADQMQ